jgi:hypothetical protein
MRLRRFAAIALACSAWIVAAPAAERYYPVDDVKPGMVAIGRTVFKGDTLEEFKANILGVLRNTIAPGRDLVLARLEGGPLARTGVIAGMSGSPVYIDGRMVGAVSYSLGTFSTEAIAGITPIGEMIDASRLAAARVAAAPVPMPAYVTAETFRTALESRVPATLPASGRTIGLDAMLGVYAPVAGTASLRPIAVPLSLAGIDPGAFAPLSSVLSRLGFVVAPGIGGQDVAAAPAPAALRPGDPVGVTLLSGDYAVGASGTVTEVDGQRVYAFGHPFYGLGPAQLPMTRAYIHTVLPSLMASTKVASIGQIVGTFTQDRATVLAGVLGDGPATIPLSITLPTPSGTTRTLRLRLANDPFFTPLLAFVAVGSTLSTFERDLGTNTYAVRVRVKVSGHDAVEFADCFAGDMAATSAAAALATPLAALLTNDIEPVRVEGLSAEIVPVEHDRTTVIRRAWIDTSEPQAGQPLRIKVVLRPFRGTDELRTIDATLPPTARGPLTLVVADGEHMAQSEARDGFTSGAPVSLDQLLGRIRRTFRNNTLYVRLYSRDAGAVVGGDAMPGLPDSVLTVIDGERDRGGATTLRSTLVGAWDVALDVPVSGSRSLSVTPLPPVRRP